MVTVERSEEVRVEGERVICWRRMWRGGELVVIEL